MQFIKILNPLMDQGTISKEELSSFGYDVTSSSNSLFMEEDGVCLPNINAFIQKGIGFCFRKDYDTAKKIVMICKKQDQKSNPVALFDFYIALSENKSEEFFQKLEALEDSCVSEKQKRNFRYFAAITDYLLDTPVESSRREMFSFDEMKLIKGENTGSLYARNEIRKKMYYHQFGKAKERFDHAPKNRYQSLDELIHGELIQMSYDKSQEFRDRVCYYMERGEINQAIELLEREHDLNHLSLEEQFALDVSLQIQRIHETNLIPQPIPLKRRDRIYSEIEHQNYKQAFDQYRKTFGDQVNSPLYHALNQINQLIRKKSHLDFSNIQDIVYKGNYDALLICLQKYGCQNYYELVKDFIRYGKFKEDIFFEDALAVLQQLLYKEYSFDFSHYMDLFEDAVLKEDEIYARLYLRMIVHADFNHQHKDYYEEARKLYRQVFGKDFFLTGAFSMHVYRKMHDLRDGKYVLTSISHCNREEQERAKELLSHERDIRIKFLENQNQLMLFYSPFMKDFDATEELSRADKFYQEKNYEEAASCYARLIMYHNYSPRVFGNYGICLYELGRYEEAYDTLQYTLTLYSKDKDKVYFQNLISYIRLKEGDDKVLFGKPDKKQELISSFPFVLEVQKCLDEGYSLMEAASVLNLSETEMQVLHIIYARDSYIMDEAAEGNFHLRLVDIDSVQDRNVKNLYYETLDDRFFFHRRYQGDRKKVLFKK